MAAIRVQVNVTSILFPMEEKLNRISPVLQFQNICLHVLTAKKKLFVYSWKNYTYLLQWVAYLVLLWWIDCRIRIQPVIIASGSTFVHQMSHSQWRDMSALNIYMEFSEKPAIYSVYISVPWSMYKGVVYTTIEIFLRFLCSVFFRIFSSLIKITSLIKFKTRIILKFTCNPVQTNTEHQFYWIVCD
jgi:hypothetical protein